MEWYAIAAIVSPLFVLLINILVMPTKREIKDLSAKIEKNNEKRESDYRELSNKIERNSENVANKIIELYNLFLHPKKKVHKDIPLASARTPKKENTKQSTKEKFDSRTAKLNNSE